MAGRGLRERGRPVAMNGYSVITCHTRQEFGRCRPRGWGGPRWRGEGRGRHDGHRAEKKTFVHVLSRVSYGDAGPIVLETMASH